MANTASAKKRVRQNTKLRLRNRRRKELVKGAIRQFETAMTAGDKTEAQTKLRQAEKAMDRVSAKGTIHKRTAARKKSRLAKRLNKLAAKV